MQDNCNDKGHWITLFIFVISILMVVFTMIGASKLLKDTGGSNLDDLELDFEAQNDVIRATSTTRVKEVVIEPTEDRRMFTSEANPVLYMIEPEEIKNLTPQERGDLAIAFYLNGMSDSIDRKLFEELLELFVPARFKVEDGG